MKKILQIFVFIMLAGSTLIVCKKPYEPPLIKGITNFLVIDGSIICGNNSVTTITLSRTKALSDSILFDPELNAVLTIEQEGGGTFNVSEQGNGMYRSQPLNLAPGRQYRLKVKTADNREYLSGFVAGKTTPAIDSLTWKQDGNVTVSVHTHDPLNDTRYYRWDYTETWNYASIYSTDYGVNNGLIFVKDANTQTDSCWRTGTSTNIITGSSLALNEDVISNVPVAVVSQHDERISKGYSILVRQYAISEAAFRYLQLIQKNTQQLGSLFDAQPSQLKGNIQCVDDPNEPVIGFISASAVTDKRIFIRNRQLKNWIYALPVSDCTSIIFIAQDPTDYRIYTYPDPLFAPYYFTSGGIALTRKACLYCTEQGGTNVKPSFW
ncbi:MAG: DUF4249 domain-containing protein [Ferruginibacter sp.]